MNKKLIAALFAGAFAFASVSAMADDKTPAQPFDQAKAKAERDAAKSKWAAMSAEEKAATKKAAQSKKVSDLSAVELLADEGNPGITTPADTAKLKAEREAAKAKYDKMTPEEKAAMKKAAQSKKLSELTLVEKISVGQ
jgi:hypothetical protein